MIVTVKKFEDKSTEKGLWFTITDENNKVHNLFGSKIPDLENKKHLVQQGMTVELTKVKNPDNAKWWDVTDVKPATVKEAVQKEETSQYAFRYYEQKCMNRRTALMQAVEVTKELDDIMLYANAFNSWLNGDIETHTEPVSRASSEVTAPLEIVVPPTRTVKECVKALNDKVKELGWAKTNVNAWLATIKKKVGGKTSTDEFTLTDWVVAVKELYQEYPK